VTQNMATMQPITEVVWKEKYRHSNPDGSGGESSIEASFGRVVAGVYEKDERKDEESPRALDSMVRRHWVPAGRIQAGAGTGKRVTWINCFVSPTIEDSMKSHGLAHAKGIMDSLSVAAITQQMGGGIGMDFSTLRPRGAIVRKVGSVSSGPLCFMDMWHAMCGTIMSSGSRRGAMMGTLRIDHPDILEFIEAKHVQGRLTNFNVSVLVTNAFMEALKNGGEWDLGFTVPRADGNHVDVRQDIDIAKGEDWYVYHRLPAVDLWEMILKSTYDYAEPGVIFIDRVNERNNLNYCEHISATNPCGEQPLPPNGDCNLGAVNLAAMVNDAFGTNPEFDWDALDEAVQVGVRFLDNVLDTTLYPTEEQKSEALAKRRIGLGITGLGNMLQQMKIRYGSKEATDFTEDVMKSISHCAYRASVDLAEERGSFPMFNADQFLKSSFVMRLPVDIKEGIREVGIRNGVLLTIAPTGTTSLYIGNVSSGCEPSFAWSYQRKMLMEDNTQKEFDVEDYGYLMHCRMFGKPNGEMLPDYMVTATELTVLEHLEMQGALQKHVDASISKTINCPEDMEFDEFKQVYSHAYDLGLKGCTTYRPSGVRGSVLSVKGEEKPRAIGPVPERPQELEGSTYKVKWAPTKAAFYVTINDRIDRDGNRVPFEIFINTMSVKHSEWISALTRTISAVFRRGGDVTFLPDELEQIHSSDGGQWVGPNEYVPSLVAIIGKTINRHFVKIGLKEPRLKPELVEIELTPEMGGERCPDCEHPKSFVMTEGCGKCLSCGYSSCG